MYIKHFDSGSFLSFQKLKSNNMQVLIKLQHWGPIVLFHYDTIIDLQIQEQISLNTIPVSHFAMYLI